MVVYGPATTLSTLGEVVGYGLLSSGVPDIKIGLVRAIDLPKELAPLAPIGDSLWSGELTTCPYPK
jgi:hypothetical protein